MFQVISECYERKSLIITSNLEFSGWNTVLGDNRPDGDSDRPTGASFVYCDILRRKLPPVAVDEASENSP